MDNKYAFAIPFGGKNITHDIKNELQISERLAENIKLAFGACLPDKLQSLSEKVLVISGQTAVQQKEVTVKYLSEIITARVEEIIQAILYEISESGLAEHLSWRWLQKQNVPKSTTVTKK